MKLWLLFLLSLLITLSFTPTTHSQKCTSQTFTNNKLYKNCTDLPTLDSYLHYNYDADESTLSVVFIAPPAKPDGWIAWGINPNGTGMIGTQALIAYKKSDGKMTVKTYNLVSYRQIVQSKLSFDVSDMSAEYSDGVMRIFAKFELPENMTVINQVWQVGAVVNNEIPAKHAFDPVNLNAKAELKLDKSAGKNSTGAPNPSPSKDDSNDKDKKENGSSRIGDTGFGLIFVVLFSLFGVLVL
ncbi:cytochrome b561 and DOMON domain-containing protein At3g25290 [Apium graveolens]|uniref:cytochrome b561 and DOMON domain-containing protein At3g25290 n=1 Tax=Apium graveolens TaxID=4045 RepID=UPI003D799AA3